MHVNVCMNFNVKETPKSPAPFHGGHHMPCITQGNYPKRIETSTCCMLAFVLLVYMRTTLKAHRGNLRT